jgi:hypothetical protein
MTLRKRINSVVATFGLLSVFFSLAFLFATPTYADETGCQAAATCCGGSASCDCPSGGHCTGGNGTVQCTCNVTSESSAGTCTLCVD